MLRNLLFEGLRNMSRAYPELVWTKKCRILSFRRKPESSQKACFTGFRLAPE